MNKKSILLFTSVFGLSLTGCSLSDFDFFGLIKKESPEYTIQWKNYDGSLLEEDKNVKEGETPTYDGTTPVHPSDDKYEYEFNGWSPEVKPASKDQTYVATFESSKIEVYHTVTFDTHGGGEIPSQRILHGEKANKPTDPSKNGYDFNCWKYNDEEWLFLAYTVTDDITLDADYDINHYSIEYNLNGGELLEPNPYSYTVEDSFVLNSPSRDDFEFTGWTDQNGNVITSIGPGTTGDLELTAHWQGQLYELNVYSNDETLGTVSIVYGTGSAGEEIKLLATPAEGATFVGWYLYGSSEYTTLAEITFTMPSMDVVLMAKFELLIIPEFNFSIKLNSEKSSIALGESSNQVVICDNTVDTAGRTYTFESSNPSIATIDNLGNITPVSKGKVNFIVTETNSQIAKSLKRPIEITDELELANGGFSYSDGSPNQKEKIIAQLEKYGKETHLEGIPLFEDGGLVKYSDRVALPTTNYIQGYGFGLLEQGTITGSLPGSESSSQYPTYFHDYLTQDSLKINRYTASSSVIKQLSDYITSPYWGKRLTSSKNDYEFAPILAAEKIHRPIINQSDEIVGYESELTYNSAPIPMEKANAENLYKTWRIYVKTDDTFEPGLKYTKYKNDNSHSSSIDYNWTGRSVTLEDYMFTYKMLLNGTIGGIQLFNDSKYSIKGAEEYYREAMQHLYSKVEIDNLWSTYINSGRLGLMSGVDDYGCPYIEVTFNNPIDSYNALTFFTDNSFSPLPEEFFTGANGLKPNGNLRNAIDIYGTFNNGSDNEVLNNTICLGAFSLLGWEKYREIVFSRNDDWFEVGDKYHIDGVYYRVIDTSTDTEKTWKHFLVGNLDYTTIPASKIAQEQGKPNVCVKRGEATMKLNVNALTQEQWNEKFGPNGTLYHGGSWEVKPWMSNADFLDGLYYSIDRASFAEKRGLIPSTNFFSDSYRSSAVSIYNDSASHLEAVSDFSENFGFNKQKAIDCFRSAVKTLSDSGNIILGTKDNPTTINIHIRWMYVTDIKEYGEDIKYFIEDAFNDVSVCGGRVKLSVKQDAVTNWEDIYDVYIYQGRYDLAFSGVTGGEYDALNFFKFLKSDNSSGLTLSYGSDTSKVDSKNPIIFDGKTWSFDALYEAGNSWVITENGVKTDALRSNSLRRPKTLDGSSIQNDLYKGFRFEMSVDFFEIDSEQNFVSCDINKLDVYVFGYQEITIAENSHDGDSPIYYDRDNKKIVAYISNELAEEVNDAIKKVNGWIDDSYSGADEWKNNPFIFAKLESLFCFEFYYDVSSNGGKVQTCYAKVNVVVD